MPTAEWVQSTGLNACKYLHACGIKAAQTYVEWPSQELSMFLEPSPVWGTFCSYAEAKAVGDAKGRKRKAPLEDKIGN